MTFIPAVRFSKIVSLPSPKHSAIAKAKPTARSSSSEFSHKQKMTNRKKKKSLEKKDSMRRMKPESSVASSSSSSSSCSYDFSSWADLPPELLDNIFALLTSSDSLRFRLICPSWRSLARLSPPPFPVPFEPPRLLLPRPDNSLFFFNVFNNKPLSFPIPPSHCYARCFCYLSGWFFFVSDQYPSRACLLNPFLGAEIPLPDLEFPIVKTVLSASPSSPYCVVAVMGRSRSSSIALCEPAGKKWHMFQLGNRNLREIIFWNNKVCAIDKNGNLLLCNFNMESCKTEIQTVDAPKPHIWTDGRELEAFLVESIDGGLLVVAYDSPQLLTPFDSQFHIYKLFQNASAEWGDKLDRCCKNGGSSSVPWGDSI